MTNTAKHPTYVEKNITGQWQARCAHRRCIWRSLPFGTYAGAVAAGHDHRDEVQSA